MAFIVGTASTAAFDYPNTGLYDTKLSVMSDGSGDTSGSITGGDHPPLSGVVLSAAAAPEPSSWALLGIGLACLMFVNRRRNLDN